MNRVYGLLLLFALLFCACGKTRTSYAVKGEFRYYNRVGHTIQINLRQGLNQAFASYTIVNGDSIIINTTGATDQDAPADPKGYMPGIAADTCTIHFSNALCYTEYNKKGTVLHNIDKYTYLKRGDRDYIFYFTIDTNLRNLSGDCP